MRASSGKRHGELMALSVAITVGEQAAQGMGEKLQPDRERCRTVEQTAPFVRREIVDAFEVKQNRFPEGTEDLLERPPLDRDVEIEADCLPIAVPAFGVAAQTSGCQLQALRT